VLEEIMATNISVSLNKEVEGLGNEILLGVKLQSFEASPATIEPFEQSQLSWRVSGPSNKFTVRLNGETVAANGRATVNPDATTAYQLEARAFGAKRALGKISVVVNLDNCFQGAILQGQLEAEVRNHVANLLQPGGEVALRDPVGVTVDEGGIELDLPFKVDINNFFDAELDMKLKFSLGLTPGRNVRARLNDINVNAKFHPLEHLGSLFTATALQAFIQQLARAFVGSFIGPQLQRDLATSIQDAIVAICALAGHPDDRILSISTVVGQVQFVCCGVSEEAQFSDVLHPTGALIG
jgi:hypothetical protein